MIQPQRILIASDEAFPAPIRAALEHRGFEVTIAQDFKSGYSQLLQSAFDLAIVDLAEGTDGVDFIKRIRATTQLSKTVILATAEWGTGQATLALSQGADAFEPKPLDAPSLVAAVERLLVKQKAVAQ